MWQGCHEIAYKSSKIVPLGRATFFAFLLNNFQANPCCVNLGFLPSRRQSGVDRFGQHYRDYVKI
jgi:hypothetical protein